MSVWISIRDQEPAVGEEVFLYVPKGASWINRRVCTGHLTDQRGHRYWFIDGSPCSYNDVDNNIYWLPMPELPLED